MSTIYIYINALLLLFCVSCDKFLDVKPDQKISTISSSDDLLALMSNSTIMNMGYSGLPEIAADNYYLTEEDWNALVFEEYRGSYLWKKIPMHSEHWNTQYTRVMYANIVLDEIDKVKDGSSSVKKDHIKGMAYFFRAYTMMNLMEIFCPSFNEFTAGDKLGLVLKSNSNINEEKPRSSLLETIRFIEADLKESARLLPINQFEYPTRPFKGAALGALSRLYLNIGDYERAEKYADEALGLTSKTLDYTGLDYDLLHPFDQYNEDIIFFSTYAAQNILLFEKAKVDEILYQSFSDNDYRKKLFFSIQDNGSILFKGNYQSLVPSEQFSGITVGELILIKAEAAARRSRHEIASIWLMKLLTNRYGIVPEISSDLEKLLIQIKNERRKELLFRGVRWGDLKRFSKDDSFELIRNFKNNINKMTSEELSDFSFYIPQEVIESGNVIQNK